jgi:signal transduction histidine kinase/DNA-binding response OmpR family regulator/CHASE3 domain sensor protein
LPTSKAFIKKSSFLSPNVAAGFGVAIAAVVLISIFSYRSLIDRDQAAQRVTHTFAVIDDLQELIALLTDAETGQRGFLLTGEERYLEPYENARNLLPVKIDAAESKIIDNAAQHDNLRMLRRIVDDKMMELTQTIALYRSGEIEKSITMVKTDRGRELMGRIRDLIVQMEKTENQLFEQRQQEWREISTLSVYISIGGAAVLLILIGIAAIMTSRDFRATQANAWIRTGQAGLAEKIQGDLPLHQLCENILSYLADYLNAQIGAIYVTDGHSNFRSIAGYALPAGMGASSLKLGEGLLGQIAKEKRTVHVNNIPSDYFSITSSVGLGKPRELIVAPAMVDRTVHAVIELGFFRNIDSMDRELMDRMSETLGVAVRAAKDRSRLEELLGETQRQAEELQAQQEELRVSNEELEEQSRVLRESQAELEAQQTELEQTNSHLEEQTQLLEHQKEELSKAQIVLREKAAELERSNQFKSEFLANMSHELRTPLNSTLILAKLLADNKDNNLTDEQVRFAQTISSSGNDLLTLINDILDLSKIEAGAIELEPATIIVADEVQKIVKPFEPLAQQKGLHLKIDFGPDVPLSIETDAQRVGQILKNLISNAIKFTERGRISIQVYAPNADAVAFAIKDTGIGIPEHQQEIIFEAFRQADGSTHRKYGGTGLGLSISRDLAQLLGGTITINSAPAEGSTFTLTLPRGYGGRRLSASKNTFSESDSTIGNQSNVANQNNVANQSNFASQNSIQSLPVESDNFSEAVEIDDDRNRLTADSRVILAIEDDTAFAFILRDLTRERGFQSIITHNGRDGLLAATKYLPRAIILDINLPDHTGLYVLDELKRNSKTRHIPVHVVSAQDYTREALERGAIGYALKPVKRDQLIMAFERLEAKSTQELRNVLVVEDDARQRESISQLLSNDQVQIIAVETANEALTQLQNTTFDCMVMDLNLPDLSGYELLKQMATHQDLAFPPVIVYTGRSLTRDEELNLGRYSQSIIIKDARSPERLLDEVTLFLHQVEAQLPPDRQKMLKVARNRETIFDGRQILIVEDDARNIFALSSILEPKGAKIQIARNGREALQALDAPSASIDLVLMDLMMPEMDGLTAMREIRKQSRWQQLPIIALTAKAMQDDREKSLAAGANDYIAKPLDVEKLLSLMRVWMPKV